MIPAEKPKEIERNLLFLLLVKKVNKLPKLVVNPANKVKLNAKTISCQLKLINIYPPIQIFYSKSKGMKSLKYIKFKH